MAALLAPQAQRQRDLLALISLFDIEHPGGAGGDRALQFPEDPFGGGERKPSHFIMTKSTTLQLPSWQLTQSSIICPGLKDLPFSLPDSLGGQKMPMLAYCPTLVCVCGNDCHNDPEYHLRITGPLVDTDVSEIEDMFSTFTTADPDDEDVLVIDEKVVR